MLLCGKALITEQGGIWWKELSQTTPHLTQLSSGWTWGSPATRAFGQQAPAAQAPVAAVSRPYMAWFSRFSKKRQRCLMMETSQSFAKPAPRTGPVHQQDVPRQNLNHFSRVTHTRGRPVHTFSLLPARGVKRKPTSVKKNTPDRPHGTTSLHPTGAPIAELLEAEPPSSAHARADIFIRLLPKHQPLLDALYPCLQGWVGIAGQTYGNTVHGTSTRLRTDGIRSARSDTLHGGKRSTRARSKAGQMLVLWRSEAFFV